MQAYIVSNLDPFDTKIPQPKLLDNSVDYSAGVKFRQTGNFSCDPAVATHVWLFPGISTPLNWRRTADVIAQASPSFTNHAASDRASIKRWRLVSCGLKFNLLNSGDEDDGIWEAVRVPNVVTADVSSITGDATGLTVRGTGLSDLPAYRSYQSGRLKDLHRFMFKLNSQALDHPFKNGAHSGTESNLDQNFDAIYIKITGRLNATSPSVLMYDVVSNQEIVYEDNTIAGRLLTYSPHIKTMEANLEKTKFDKPAVQIS